MACLQRLPGWDNLIYRGRVPFQLLSSIKIIKRVWLKTQRNFALKILEIIWYDLSKRVRRTLARIRSFCESTMKKIATYQTRRKIIRQPNEHTGVVLMQCLFHAKKGKNRVKRIPAGHSAGDYMYLVVYCFLVDNNNYKILELVSFNFVLLLHSFFFFFEEKMNFLPLYCAHFAINAHSKSCSTFNF